MNTFSGFVTLLGNDGNDTVQNIGTTMQGNFNLSGGKGNDNLDGQVAGRHPSATSPLVRETTGSL